jgi:hypothetical protein
MRALLLRLWNSPTFTTWGSMATRLSAVAVVLPIVLIRFAPAEVAVWQLFASISTLILLFDFGLSPTFSRLLAFARGGAPLDAMGDMRKRPTIPSDATPDEISAKVFSTLMWVYPRLGMAIVILIGLLGTVALQRPIGATADPSGAWIAWVVVLGTSVLSFNGNAYAAALQGMDSIAPLRRWEVATGLAQIGTSLLVLMLNGGLLALVISYQCWLVVNLYRNRRLLKALHPILFSIPARRDSQVMTVLWPATWRSGVGVLMSQGIIQSSGVIYSQVAPATEVASYLLALRLITTVSQFSQAPFYSKLPKLAELQASQQRDQQLATAQRGMRTAHWIFVLGVLAATAFVGPLLESIGSHTSFVAPEVWAVMGLAFFVERYGAMHLQLYSLTNHIVWHIANGITGVVMIAAAVTLYPILHTLAFPIAMLIAYAGFYAIYSVNRSATALNIPLFTFEAKASLLPACILGIGLGTSLLIASTK